MAPLVNKVNSFPRTAKENTSGQQSYYTTLLESSSELDDSSLTSYTSLKDLIPPSQGSSKHVSLTIQSAYEIPITNMLVKKAAWGYLQPALPRDEFSTNTTDHILCLASPVKTCFRFVRRNIISKIVTAFEKLLNAIHLGRSRTLSG